MGIWKSGLSMPVQYASVGISSYEEPIGRLLPSFPYPVFG